MSTYLVITSGVTSLQVTELLLSDKKTVKDKL